MSKISLSCFLSQNPFSHPLTTGFFFREKMRAIHHIAPDAPFKNIVEIGGGQSGLTAALYPKANVITVDYNFDYASAPCNRQKNVSFVLGNAVQLPFKRNCFDVATMFDLLEHITDHKTAIAEVLRVLRPGGFLLLSTPNENWRFPFYSVMTRYCPSEEEMFREWGHVRRGYSLFELENLISIPFLKCASFITPITVIGHDISFSRFDGRMKHILCLLLSPVIWGGYILQNRKTLGTETASLWKNV